MTDKQKNWLLMALSLAVAVQGFLLYIRQPKVVTSTKYLTQKVYVTSDATITGATSVTTNTDGCIASGTNLTIKQYHTSTTTVTEKETVKYNINLIILEAGYNLNGMLDVELSIKLDNYLVGVDYCINRNSWGVRAGVVIFQW